MAIDETELPKGPADAPGDDTIGARAAPSFAVDDFRLRLDSPLFHRDPGMAATHAPALRELTWEHVVRPSQQVPVIAEDVQGPQSARSIESLLAHARDVDEPLGVADMFQPVQPLRPIESMSGEVPVVEGFVIDEVVAEQPVPAQHIEQLVVELPLIIDRVAAAPVAALYSIDDEMEPLPVLPPSKPRVESLFAALEQMDDDKPAPPVEPEADVAEIVARVVAPSLAPVVVLDVCVEEPAAESPAPAIVAELNRLAFLPDQEDEQGPVVVPAIAYTEPQVEAALPALSQHDLYTARNAAPANHTRLNLVDVATTFTPVTRKKKNGFVRFATFLIFVAVLGGAAYAGKYYFLDKRWAGEAKALAAEVETARGLTFDHAITVTTLPLADYSSKLVTATFGLDGPGFDAMAGSWRAVGVLDGAASLRQIGMSAIPDSPAFYDPATETIFVVDGLPENFRRFAMHRALTLALLDQEFGWGESIKGQSPSVARGTRAFYDGDAIATAVGMEPPTARTEIAVERYEMIVEREIGASPSPFASVVAGRLGVALRPYFESLTIEDRATRVSPSTITDGQALDVRRLTSGAVETPSQTAQGMLFWYHALASRIDENTAWTTALAWQDDELSVVPNPSGAAGDCIAARVQVDPTSLDAALAAFQAWALAAPSTSGTTVTATNDGTRTQLVISACDPGPGVPSTGGGSHLGLGGAPLRAEQYRLLSDAQPTLPASQVACAVHGGDGVSMADERSVIEDENGWPAPANHPVPDPNRLGCAPV